MGHIEFIVGLRCPYDGVIEVMVLAKGERDAMSKARRMKPGSAIKFVREAGQ